MCKYKSLQAGQLPQGHLSFLQNLLNFIITKHFKQVNDDLSICMDERSPCGLYNSRYKDFLMSGDQNVITLLLKWRSALWSSIEELFLLPTFDSSSPYVTRDKEICQSHVIRR